MTRILLAERSPHAQRMGERILREEGYSVVTVTDGETAMLRLRDVKPKLVIADSGLPGLTGFQLCEFIKGEADFAGTRIILTFGALDLVDDAQVKRSGADGALKKPLEATALLEMAARLAGDPKSDTHLIDRTQAAESATRPVRSVVVLDPEKVRAAVTVALDEAIEPLIDRVTERVVAALAKR